MWSGNDGACLLNMQFGNSLAMRFLISVLLEFPVCSKCGSVWEYGSFFVVPGTLP